MRITVPEEIMRLTVPTCTPSRDKPLVIVSSLELRGAGLHIFVSQHNQLQYLCLWQIIPPDILAVIIITVVIANTAISISPPSTFCYSLSVNFACTILAPAGQQNLGDKNYQTYKNTFKCKYIFSGIKTFVNTFTTYVCHFALF